FTSTSISTAAIHTLSLHDALPIFKKEIGNIELGMAQGDIPSLRKNIALLEREAPHQLGGKRIVSGMAKEGYQSHIHIIVSRKDRSEEHTSELQSRENLVCRLLLDK